MGKTPSLELYTDVIVADGMTSTDMAASQCRDILGHEHLQVLASSHDLRRKVQVDSNLQEILEVRISIGAHNIILYILIHRHGRCCFSQVAFHLFFSSGQNERTVKYIHLRFCIYSKTSYSEPSLSVKIDVCFFLLKRSFFHSLLSMLCFG